METLPRPPRPPGFTLIEVLLGLALAGLLALALMSLGKLSSRLTRATYLSGSASSAQELIKMVLMNGVDCTPIFRPMGLRYVPQSGKTPGITPINQDLSYVVNGQTEILLPRAGGTTPDGLIVRSVTLTDVPLPSPQPRYYDAYLSIQFERFDPTKPTSKTANANSSYGAPFEAVMQIPLAIATDSNNIVQSCSGVSPTYGGDFTTYAQCDQGGAGQSPSGQGPLGQSPPASGSNPAPGPIPPSALPPGPCPSSFTLASLGACRDPNPKTNNCTCPFNMSAYRTLELVAPCFKDAQGNPSPYYRYAVNGGNAPWPSWQPAKGTQSALPPMCGYYQYECRP